MPVIDFGNSTGPSLGFLQQSSNDEQDWKLMKTKTRTTDTGPTKDHTSGSGYYAYLESSFPVKKGDRVCINSVLSMTEVKKMIQIRLFAPRDLSYSFLWRERGQEGENTGNEVGFK